jgi:hypothetical protein
MEVVSMAVGTEAMFRGLVRHAELFGPELVFETAAGDGFGALELGRLSLQLQRVDRQRAVREGRRRAGWRLERAAARGLAAGLLGERLPDRRVAEMATCSVRTVRALRAEVREIRSTGRPQGREAAFQSGEKLQIRATLGDWSSGPVLQPGAPGARRSGAAVSA